MASYTIPIDLACQPDDVSCGPTCLHGIYRYFGDELALPEVIDQTPQLDRGGTLGVLLGCHALARGYRATITSYNLQLLDPSWFNGGVAIGDRLRDRLREQLRWKSSDHRLVEASKGCIAFLEAGGELRFDDLDGRWIRRHLARGVPVLAGLSATYLYRQMREYGPDDEDDDIRGVPSGHFVLITGWHDRVFDVADPLGDNPLGVGQYYQVSEARLIGAILLGILTHDANLLVVEPRR